jgi:hypothetical protein
MSLDPGTQFDETALTAAEFDPQDKVLPNSPVESNDVNAIASRALRRTAYLAQFKADLSGATFTGLVTFNAGATVASGQDLTLDNVSVQGYVGFSTLGTVWLAGRKRLIRPRITLADVSQDVNVSQGDRFECSALNAAPRTITLKSTGVVPDVGETLTFIWNPGGAGGGGVQYTFQREGGVIVATFAGAFVADTGAVFAEFEYTAGGWRLGKHSGTPNEYTSGPDTWTSYGVVPGPGA